MVGEEGGADTIRGEEVGTKVDGLGIGAVSDHPRGWMYVGKGGLANGEAGYHGMITPYKIESRYLQHVNLGFR